MTTERVPKALFGIPGLDDILSGGLARNRLYLVEGAPGSGKTTLALQFLLEGASAGERGLHITLSETEQELREAATSHGWTIPNVIDIFELVPPESLLDESQRQSLLYSSDLELGETTNRIFEAMERTNPRRVIIDSLSDFWHKATALSPSDPGVEAPLRAARCDGAPARRHDGGGARQDGPKRCPWCHPA